MCECDYSWKTDIAAYTAVDRTQGEAEDASAVLANDQNGKAIRPKAVPKCGHVPNGAGPCAESLLHVELVRLVG